MPFPSSMSDKRQRCLATPSGTLVPVTAGPACLVPGGIGVPDRAALAPVLARWSELAGGTPGAAIDLRAWHAAATAGGAAHTGCRPRWHHRGAARRARSRPAGLVVPGGRIRPRRTRGGAHPPRPSRLVPASSARASRRPSAQAWAPPRPATTSSVACSPDSTCSASRARTDGSARPWPRCCRAPRAARGTCWRPPSPAGTPEGLIGLAAALASASAPAVRTALAVLGRWGASSGLDQATGFAAAIRAGALVEAGAS